MASRASQNDKRILREAMGHAALSKTPLGPRLADEIRGFLRDAAKPRVIGVGRDAENPQAVVVVFTGPLEDDQLRAFHDAIRDLPFLTRTETSDGNR